MKKLIVILIALTVLMAVGACGKETTRRFKLVEEYGDMRVYVDTETGIGYGLWRVPNGRSLFPLYDKDGNLYRPNGWRDYAE